jgi:hypothetical protein
VITTVQVVALILGGGLAREAHYSLGIVLVSHHKNVIHSLVLLGFQGDCKENDLEQR